MKLNENLLIILMVIILLLLNLINLTQTDLVAKTDFDNKFLSLNRKTELNKTRHLLIEKELKKLKTFNLGYFMGKSYCDEDGTQNYFNISTNFKIFYTK